MSSQCARYIIVDPKTSSEHQFASLVFDQQVSQGPALILRSLGQQLLFDSNCNLLFRKIYDSSNHPVDTKFEIGQEYMAVKWLYENTNIEISEYQRVVK